MLQHPGNRISLESYDEEVGFCAYMHTYERKRTERPLPAKGTSGSLSDCISSSSSSSSSSSTTPSWVPLPLFKPLPGLPAPSRVVTYGIALQKC